MTYAELQKKLKDNHFYANCKTITTNNKEIIQALEIPFPVMLSNIKLQRIREVIGDTFNADYVSGSETVLITKK